MKPSLKSSFTLIVLSIGFALPCVYAQEPAVPDSSEIAPKEAVKGQSGRRQDALIALNLTADQKSKVAAIRKDERASLAALKADTSVNETNKKAKRKEIADAHRTQIRAILTPEQQVKFDALPKQGARVGKTKADKTVE